ncbi:MAG TPA: ClbS/DfsB family four-helix bundle protein [Ktedonobacterales bacterium]|nr:ClbS/DfsB family four-helix bundle protein [Ktedonobacterales bacterium]
MEQQMGKAELLGKMRRGRTAWEALVAEVPRERMTESGVEGDWSLKDVLIHVAIYEDWMADQLEGLARGETDMRDTFAIPFEVNGFDVNERNAWFFRANRARALDDVLAETQRTFPRLLAAVERLTDDDLNETQRYVWTGGAPVWDAVGGNSFDHYDEHMPNIRAWLARSAA